MEGYEGMQKTGLNVHHQGPEPFLQGSNQDHGGMIKETVVPAAVVRAGGTQAYGIMAKELLPIVEAAAV